MLIGKYDNKFFVENIYPAREMARRISLLKKHGMKNYVYAPEIEFNDFRPVSLDLALLNANYEGTDFEITQNFEKVTRYEFVQKNEFFYFAGWWRIHSFSDMEKDSADTFLILYDDYHAFEAELTLPPKIRSRLTKYHDIYAEHQKKFFIGNQLYFDSLPHGAYKTAIKVLAANGAEYYFPMNDIITVKN